jgi:hypothetical protein
MPDNPAPSSELVLYQTEDGQTRIQCRFENETIWLTQALIGELFHVSVPTVNEHLKGIYAEAELQPRATIRKFRIVRTEGGRQVNRELEHYSLDAILAVGYRVRSQRGVQFRQWAKFHPFECGVWSAECGTGPTKWATKCGDKARSPSSKCGV